MISRILPHPLLTLALLAVWQMLVNSVSLGSLVFGLILGLAIPLMTAPYWPDRPKVRNLPMMVEFALVVLWDIVMANISVARIVLFMRNEDLRTGWITVPLDLRSP